MPVFGGGAYRILGTNILGGIGSLAENAGNNNIGLGNSVMVSNTQSNTVAIGNQIKREGDAGDSVIIGHEAATESDSVAGSVIIGTDAANAPGGQESAAVDVSNCVIIGINAGFTMVS